jgi:hypothetical protein
LIGTIKSQADAICWKVEDDGLSNWRGRFVDHVELRESLWFGLETCEDIVQRGSQD